MFALKSNTSTKIIFHKFHRNRQSESLKYRKSCRNYFHRSISIDRLEDLEIFTFLEQYIKKVCTFVYKHKDLFSVADRNTYNTRYKSQLMLEKHNALYKKGTYYNYFKYFNLLPISIQTEMKELSFKMNLKHYLLQKTNLNYILRFNFYIKPKRMK